MQLAHLAPMRAVNTAELMTTKTSHNCNLRLAANYQTLFKCYLVTWCLLKFCSLQWNLAFWALSVYDECITSVNAQDTALNTKLIKAGYYTEKISILTLL